MSSHRCYPRRQDWLYSEGSVYLFIRTLLGSLVKTFSGVSGARQQHTHSGALHFAPLPPSNQRQDNREAAINFWPQSDRITQTRFSEPPPPTPRGLRGESPHSSELSELGPGERKLPTDTRRISAPVGLSTHHRQIWQPASYRRDVLLSNKTQMARKKENVKAGLFELWRLWFTGKRWKTFGSHHHNHFLWCNKAVDWHYYPEVKAIWSERFWIENQLWIRFHISVKTEYSQTG